MVMVKENCLLTKNTTYLNVVNKALLMVQDFSDVVSTKYKISSNRITDREVLRECVGTSISLLIDAGVNDAITNLIKEINRLGYIFCQNPIYTPNPPLESRDPVYYIYEVFLTVEFEHMVLNKKKPVVVEFYSDYHTPSPNLDKVIRKHEGKVYLARLNRTYLDNLASTFNVKNTPAIIAFKHGIVSSRFQSSDTSLESSLDKFVSDLLE